VNSALFTVVFSVDESVSTCSVWAETSTDCWISPVSRLMSTRTQFGRLDQHPGAIELLEALHLCAQSVLAPLQELERVLARFVRDCLEFDARLHVARVIRAAGTTLPDESSTVREGSPYCSGSRCVRSKTQERHAKKGPESAGFQKPRMDLVQAQNSSSECHRALRKRRNQSAL